MNISYPYRQTPKVSLGLFVFLAVIVPIVTIVSVSLYFLPQHDTSRPATRDWMWRRKLWEMNAGLLGLGVSLATATVIFTGVKNLTGKPRPYLLAICDPDMNHVPRYAVGGLGQNISSLWVMVNEDICQQPDKKWLNDGFRSFPSGYATSKWISRE